jgi:asparagine synthase (glutamine-hydrolysing)
MAVSLEGREPFLDHTVIEFSAGIPDELMHKEKTNKYLLRQLLYRYVPKEMVDRPKQGFGVPMSQWLKHDLRYLIDEYLSESAIESTGLLQPEVVAKEKVDFLSGRQPYNRVWSLIILQMWYKEYLK